MNVYFPSMYGDFHLKATAEGCTLITKELSALERRIVQDILKKYKIDIGKDSAENSGFKIKKPIGKVNDFMTKLIAKHKKTKTITAVKIAAKDADHIQLEEVRGEITGDDGDAITTPVPKRGCPMPVYDAVAARHIRAEDVLKRFLRPHQVEDYQVRHAFVVFGGQSGHRFLVSHRHSRSAMLHGIVCDLDNECKIVCVEPSTLPPSEEVLAIMVALQCRETEWVNSQN